MGTNGTSLATQEQVQMQQVPTDEEIQGIRRAGQQLALHNREVAKLAEQIGGLQWGSGTTVVKGASLSLQTRQVFAEFCRITKANPITHVDMLGGRPYLNAYYWSDLLNSHPLFVRYEQRDLSASVEAVLRERAARLRTAGDTAKAAAIEDEADELATARARWSPPANIAVVIETTIHRFINQAPIEAIRNGRVTDISPFVVTVTECNWAGGKSADPVGNANPGLTARTRSFRRAAVKAFSAWMEPFSAQIEKAEHVIEAEFEIIQEDTARALPASTGPQAVASTGEPTAAAAAGAQPLPVRGEAPKAPVASQPAPEASQEPAQPSFDAARAQRWLFATLREAGISGDERKEWQAEHELPASTKDWTKEHYKRAEELLVGPTRKKVEDGCELFGIILADLALEVLQKDVPATLKDWKALDAELERRATVGVDL